MSELINAYQAQCKLWNELYDLSTALSWEEGIANEWGWEKGKKERMEAEVADLEERIQKNDVVIRNLMIAISGGGRL